jgi:ADP-heptose:LPS heptosyltransferase
MSNILVIKHGALGDFVQAMRCFAAIRKHHKKKDSKITLLTTSPYAEFAKSSPYFDNVIIDKRPKFWNVLGVVELLNKLHSEKYDRVYDLQTSGRSSFYFNLMLRKPEWSGVAWKCSHPHNNKKRDLMHTLERQEEQLHQASVVNIPSLGESLKWIEKAKGAKSFNLPDKIALLVPGGSPHRPEKRWPSEKYGELANVFVDNGVTPIIIGTKDEEEEINTILSLCSGAISLAGSTSFIDIALLAKKAVCAIGNDTGPMHLISAVGCSSIVLYSNASNPDLCGQRGKDVKIMRKENISDISVDEVVEKTINWLN